MKRAIRACLPVVATLFLLTSPTQVVAQRFILPKDGAFYIQRKRAFIFKATLTENWVNPHLGAGTLHVFAPVLPQLPGQGNVSTRLFVVGNDKLKSEKVVEANDKRPMLRLRIPLNHGSPKSGISLRVQYEGTLFARTLRRGKSPVLVPGLTAEERRRYLKTSITQDHGDPEFRRWMNDQGLNRRKNEQAMAFAHRAFSHLVKKGKYGGDTSGYETRRPSRVCKSLANDCGGLSLLFVAVMRANGVPARALFGRWAIQQTDGYGQYHVTAEFFVDHSGWVPVDVSGTIVHKPSDPNAFFGNSDGQLLTFHVDTDLEPARGFQHAWAQYLLLQWVGSGDFWKEHRPQSKWDVVRRPVKG